jgi:hypothetical protein
LTQYFGVFGGVADVDYRQTTAGFYDAHNFTDRGFSTEAAITTAMRKKLRATPGASIP